MNPPKSVNEAFHKMTVAELEENLAYWKAKLAANPTPGAAANVTTGYVIKIEAQLRVKRPT